MITQKKLAEQLGVDYGYLKPAMMPPTKLEGFYEQFSWAVKYTTHVPVHQVYASCVEPDILNHGAVIWIKIKMHWPNRWEIEDKAFPVELYLLDENGQILTVEGQRIVYRRKHWYSLGKTRATESCQIKSKVTEGTIESTLKELKERANDVRFILSCCKYTKALIVYKIPQGLSLLEWVNRQRAAEREQFQTACEAIDAEAVNS